MYNFPMTTSVILRELGFSKINTIDIYKIIQYKLYITQFHGVPLGYAFVWALTGVHSDDLTEDLYKLSPDIPDTSASTLKEPFKIRLSMINEFFAEIEHLFVTRNYSGRPLWREVSSIIYLYNNAIQTPVEISSKLKSSVMTIIDIELILEQYLNTFTNISNALKELK